MNIFEMINKPTMLLNTSIAKKNISNMVGIANKSHIKLRPHFKTHQSGEIGKWFSEEKITGITVSSVSMADYFAHHGWQDIMIAFPTNIREMGTIDRLAGEINLGLLVESIQTIDYLERSLNNVVDLWIKVDSGSRRTGLDWQNTGEIANLAKKIIISKRLRLQGLLTHAGNTYHTNNTNEIKTLFAESVSDMNFVRKYLESQGTNGLQISVGDTPGVCLSDEINSVDEIRPGNFIFFDAMQYHLGSCQFDEIALAVVCPVVALHPERSEVVTYGGAIHLSKDYFENDGIKQYGLVAFPSEDSWGWGALIPGAYVAGLSQEHGVIHMPASHLHNLKVGDLLCILPAHSCLVVDQMREYLTLDGGVIKTLYTETSKLGFI